MGALLATVLWSAAISFQSKPLPATHVAAALRGVVVIGGGLQWAPPPWNDPVQPQLRAPPCLPSFEPPRRWLSVDEAIAASYTDKGPSMLNLPRAASHEYGTAYARHVGPLRDRALSVLEIGVGCVPVMPVEGASLPFWRAYVPCAHLTWMDFDSACVARVEGHADAVFHGDQSNPADLERVFAQGGPFHVIVDDGGHSMRQQITTLRTYFPKLPPGGVYILEDLLTSFLPSWMDLQPAGTTTHRFLSDVIAHLHRKRGAPEFVAAELLEGAAEVARLALGVDCFREVCVLIRNDQAAVSAST